MPVQGIFALNGMASSDSSQVLSGRNVCFGVSEEIAYYFENTVNCSVTQWKYKVLSLKQLMFHFHCVFISDAISLAHFFGRLSVLSCFSNITFSLYLPDQTQNITKTMCGEDGNVRLLRSRLRKK